MPYHNANLVESLEYRTLLTVAPVFEPAGSLSSTPREFTDSGALYFTADAAGDGLYREIWQAAGPNDAPRQIARFRTPFLTNGIRELTRFGDKVAFVVDAFGANNQVYVVDDAIGEAVAVTNFGSADGVSNLVSAGGYLYFQANASTGSYEELWRSDGTTGGTSRVDLISSRTNGSVSKVMVTDDKAFFLLPTITGAALAVHDPVSDTTSVLVTAESGRPIYPLGHSGEKLFFARYSPDTSAWELWETAGSPANTRPAFGVTSPLQLGDLSGRGAGIGDGFVMRGSLVDGQPGELGIPLYVHSGGVVPLITGSAPNAWAIDSFESAGGVAVSADAQNGRILLTLGTPETTSIFSPSLGSRLMAMTREADTFYFVFKSGDEYAVYRNDGITMQRLGSVPHSPDSDKITVAAGKLVFAGRTETFGEEPMSFDLETAEVSLIADLNVSSQNQNIDSLVKWKGKAFFKRYSLAERDWYLWSSTGFRDESVSLGRVEGSYTRFADLGEKLLVLSGSKLSVTDGTAEGTVTVGPANLQLDTYADGSVTVLDGVAYFSARIGSASGYELWRSNGTTEGTWQVADINAGAANSSPTRLTTFNGRVFFFATDETYGREVFSTDGTLNNIQLLRDFAPGPAGGADQTYYGGIFAVDNRLLIQAYDPSVGVEIWTSDGTQAGTVLLKDLSPRTDEYFNGGGTWYRSGNFVFVDLHGALHRVNVHTGDIGAVGPVVRMGGATLAGTFYYLGLQSSDTIGAARVQTLWRIGPNDTHATAVRSWEQTYGSADTGMLGVLGDRLYFGLAGVVTGAEIWSTDGTNAGTVLEEDHIGGPGNSTPSEWLDMTDFALTTLRGDPNNRLFRFSANAHPSTGSGRLSGTLYADGNRSGTRDHIEGPIDNGGYLVGVDLNSNGLIDESDPTTTAGFDGKYVISGLPTGSYALLIDQVVGTYGNDVTHIPATVTISNGESVDGLDIGLAYSYLTYVFNDLDADGVFDANEPGIVGATVYIDSNNNSQLDQFEMSFVTDARGVAPVGLPSGSPLVLRQILPASWAESAPAAGFAIASSGDAALAVPLNFGRYLRPMPPPIDPKTAVISGRTYNDNNANGVFDTGDVLITGKTVFLDANNNGKLDSGERSTTSSSSGVYAFANLAAGSYFVRRVFPTGYKASNPPRDYALVAGQTIANADIGSVTVGTVVTPPGENPPPPPASDPKNASIAGRTYNDNNANSIFDTGDTLIGGKTVFLDTNNNGKLDSGEVSTKSNSSGAFSFAGLAAGAYFVRRVFPSGYTYSNVPRDYTLVASQVISGADLGSVTTGTVVTPPGENPPPPPAGDPKNASIAGRTYNDNNANGVFDTGDLLITGKTVFLDANNNGKLDSGEVSTKSNSSGAFSFNGLAAGTYVVRRVFPAGYKASNPPRDYTLVASQVISGADIGSVTSGTTVTPPGDNPPPPPPPPPSNDTGSISGLLFWDSDRDGQFDTGESYQSAKTVFIDLDDDNVLDSNERKLTTDAQGRFTFDGLAAGTYVIKRVVPKGYTITTPKQTVTLSAGQVFSSVAIGTNTI